MTIGRTFDSEMTLFSYIDVVKVVFQPAALTDPYDTLDADWRRQVLGKFDCSSAGTIRRGIPAAVGCGKGEGRGEGPFRKLPCVSGEV